MAIGKFVTASHVDPKYVPRLIELTMSSIFGEVATPAIRYNLRFLTDLCKVFKQEAVDQAYSLGLIEKMKPIMMNTAGIFFNTFDLIHGPYQKECYRLEIFRFAVDTVITLDPLQHWQQIQLCLRLINARLMSVKYSALLSKEYSDIIGELLDLDYCARLVELRIAAIELDLINEIYNGIRCLLELCKTRYRSVYPILLSKFFWCCDLKSIAERDMQNIDTFEGAMVVHSEEDRYERDFKTKKKKK